MPGCPATTTRVQAFDRMILAATALVHGVGPHPDLSRTLWFPINLKPGQLAPRA